ncbi:GDYXXLXY domain-containing protein [Mesobacillus foraminis]|uniref:GDYXXLXY domain-containing protein n=1 Tax=Mesobacillus foraminis TaxID=279826 RepID=UPI000EF5578E|nr:GDYXXLXY domain-containing protein [Mesobacillus foraminis]
MPRRTKQFILACLLPIVILLGMTVTPLYTLLAGEEITLKTVPVDPTDLFRGDYVILQYEAEEIQAQLLEKEVRTKLEKGESNFEVYVPLKLDEGAHVPTKVSFEKPTSGVYLKGRVQYVTAGRDSIEEVAYVEYSLDKYFVEENTGLELEEASASGNLLAKVKVKNGYAYLVDLSIQD